MKLGQDENRSLG